MKKEESSFSVIEYIEPKDGSLFQSSLKKMFPEKYVKMAKHDMGNIKDLQKKMDGKVKQWLDE